MKKQILSTMVCIFMIISTLNAHTNKTFILPRSAGVQLPMKQSGFKKLIMEDKGSFGSYLQSVGYYNESMQQRETAKYFLVNNKHTLTFRLSANVDAAGPITTKSTVVDDVDLGYVFNLPCRDDVGHTHVSDFIAGGGTPTLFLDPRQRCTGMVLAYHQKLGTTGWLFDMMLPLVDVEQDTQLRFTGATTTVDFELGLGLLPFNVKQNMIESFTGQRLTVLDAGQDVSSIKTHTAAKLGKQRSMGAADLDVRLAYQFFSTPTYHFSLGAGVTAPMGNRPTGEFVFEAIRGNGRHWGAGGDVDMDMRVWGDCEHNIIFNATAHYRYLFATEQRRTLGLLERSFGQHYALLDSAHQAGDLLTPAANILTRPVDVTGRSQCDAVVGFTYNNHALTMDVGYNMYYRDPEVVRQRASFPNNTWYVPARGYTVGSLFDLATPAFFDGGSPATAIINDSTIDVKAAATPTQITHSIYGSLGYLFGRETESPWMLGAGGKYEMASRNSVLDTWGVWVKAGVGF